MDSLELGVRYNIGDTIFHSNPWIYTVAVDKAAICCHRCLSVSGTLHRSMIRCPDCHFSRYCSENCQNMDLQDRHKLECPAWAGLCRLHVHFPTDILLVIKALLKLLDGDLFDVPITEKSYERFNEHLPARHAQEPPRRSFHSLMSHATEIYEDLDRLKELRLMYNSYATLLQHIVDEHSVTALRSGTRSDGDLETRRTGGSSDSLTVSFDLFVEIVGKLQCNAFGILDSSFRNVGEGVYLDASIMDHACGRGRNANYWFNGPVLIVKALCPIESLKTVRICYVDTFVPKIIRRKKLEYRYYFTCNCPVCSDPMEEARLFAIKCATYGCCGRVPLVLQADDLEDSALKNQDQSRCELCGGNPFTAVFGNSTDGQRYLNYCGNLTDDHLLELEDLLSSNEANESDTREVLERCTKMLEDQRKLMHPTNFLRGLTEETIVRCLLESDDYSATVTSNSADSKILSHMLETLPVLRSFFCESDIMVAITLARIGELKVKMGSIREATAILQEAARIIRLVDNTNGAMGVMVSKLLTICGMPV